MPRLRATPALSNHGTEVQMDSEKQQEQPQRYMVNLCTSSKCDKEESQTIPSSCKAILWNWWSLALRVVRKWVEKQRPSLHENSNYTNILKRLCPPRYCHTVAKMVPNLMIKNQWTQDKSMLPYSKQPPKRIKGYCIIKNFICQPYIRTGSKWPQKPYVGLWYNKQPWLVLANSV